MMFYYKRMINTIILDYGGVLAYPISGNWFIPFDLFKIVGFVNMLKLFVKRNKLNNAFNAGNVYLNENHKLFTEEEEYEQFIHFYKIVFKELKINIDDHRIGKLAHSIVYNDYKIKFYDDVLDGITELKEKYKVIILSDTWPSAKRILDNNGILKLLDGLIMSCNYNEKKDSVKLFEIAIDKCRLVPGECLFIDDSLCNLKNAEAVGFKPVLMDRRNDTEECEYPVISGLDGIKQIMEETETNEVSS